jgi:hypothetical protein
MVSSGTARLDVALLRPTPCHCCGYRSPREWRRVILRGWMLCSDANSMPLLQILLAVIAVVTSIFICHRRVFEEIVQAWTWLHSTPAMGADGITALSPKRETGTAVLSADVGRRMNPIRAGSASQYPAPCVGLDWRARFPRISQSRSP